MGLIDRLRRLGQLPQLLATGTPPWASPWAGGDHLGTLDLPDAPELPITRDVAMSIPAVMRSRTLIVATVARTPLVIDGTDQLPGWLHGLSPEGGHPQTEFHRMLWTADDMLFHGEAAWAIERDDNGQPITALHIPRSLWARNADGTITVNSEKPEPGEVAVFDGIHSGILNHGMNSLRDASKILRAAARVADTPAALTEIRQTNDAELTDDEINAVIDRYVAARRGKRHGVGFSSTGLEVHEHAMTPANLLIEGRNAAAVDIARLVGVPAPFIDATVGGTSLSYENAASRMVELVTFGVAPIMAAIVARLNLEDLTPDGDVRFDTATTVREITNLTQTVTPEPQTAEEPTL